MIRVAIDRERCTGHGRCYSLAPEVFDADDEGYGVVRAEEVDDAVAGPARLAAASCPEDAITVVDPASA